MENSTSLSNACPTCEPRHFFKILVFLMEMIAVGYILPLPLVYRLCGSWVLDLHKSLIAQPAAAVGQMILTFLINSLITG